jgi:hypothetical protein
MDLFQESLFFRKLACSSEIGLMSIVLQKLVNRNDACEGQIEHLKQNARKWSQLIKQQMFSKRLL